MPRMPPADPTLELVGEPGCPGAPVPGIVPPVPVPPPTWAAKFRAANAPRRRNCAEHFICHLPERRISPILCHKQLDDDLPSLSSLTVENPYRVGLPDRYQILWRYR